MSHLSAAQSQLSACASEKYLRLSFIQAIEVGLKTAMDTSQVINLRPIGVVRSQIRERKAMRPLGAPATVEVLPEYADGLLRLDKHSHIWILAWLDRAERDLLQVIPRGVQDTDPNGVHGVFAVRSPARPNLIGLTVARILRIEGLTIQVDRLDFMDGTPVVDLKPYFISRDLVFSATNVQIGRPASREAMRESLLQQALNFHGEICANLALGVRAVEHFRSEILQMVEPERWKVTVPLGRPCLIDAVMGMTRASPGRGSLFFGQTDSLRFEHEGSVYEYLFVEHLEETPEELLGSADEALFRVNAIRQRS
jgi:tRNA-Thr(GGU) m(6)t(6)A37 methyltransferase TsaA